MDRGAWRSIVHGVAKSLTRLSGLHFHLQCNLWASLVAKMVESTCDGVDLGLIAGLGRSLEEGMATYSSILAWRIPWTEESDGLQSMGLQRVRHD